MTNKKLTLLVKAAWFVVVVVVLAEILFQLPNTPGNQGLAFVMLWAMLIPILRIAEGEHKWTHLGRGLLGGVAVWILSALKNHAFAQQPHPAFAVFTVGVLLFCLIAWFADSRVKTEARP
jgi:hypothetical protein